MSESSKSKPGASDPPDAGFVSLEALKGRPPADPIAEIRRIYYQTSRRTIARDIAEAIELLRLLPTEDERERAAVFMDGLAEMRSDWERQARRNEGAGPWRRAASPPKSGR